jgi:integrase
LTVITNESITIKQLYRWAVSEGLIQKHYTPDFGKIKIPIDETRRDGYTLEEYTQLVEVAGKWYQKVPKDHPTKDQEIYYRRSIRDFIVLMGNFGFRTGELRQLQYMNVKVHPDKTATVTVQPETTKVRRKREVRGRRGDIFTRRKTYSPFITREDYVFSNFSSKTPLSMETLYAYFHELVAEVQKQHKHFDTDKTPYSLRHFYISYHLLTGKVSPYEIAKLAGTSVKQIEKHYDHVQNSHIAKKILGSQTRIDRKNWEILIDDVERFEK